MRIVHVNWAPVVGGASGGGGGVGGYCQALAEEQVRDGHQVIHLSSGRTYTPDAGALRPDENPDRPGPCSVRPLPDFAKVRVFEVVNSPVLAPGHAQFRDPFTEVHCPRLDRVVHDFIASIRPDVVHLHNIEGLSAGFVDAVRSASAGATAVLYSLHNYHTVCPQVYLLRGGVYPCVDFENGHLCGGCIDAAEARHERVQRTRPKPPPMPAEPGAQRRALPVLPDPFGTAIAHFSDERYAPRDHEPPAPLHNPRPPNIFGRRREAMVRMLNACDRVIAVSRFVERLFCSLGVREDLLCRLSIGTRMAELGQEARSSRAAEPGPGPSAPVTLFFMGYNFPAKGLPMLLEALELLTPEVRGRLRLRAHGPGVPDMKPQAERVARDMAGLELGGAYEYASIPALVRDADAGIVPSTWWDTGPQTVMEFLSCGVPVLGARLGGIPDFVEHGVNGLLFRGNDRFDLARTLAGIASDPSSLRAMARRIPPLKTMTVHARELVSHYEECLGARRSVGRA